MSQKLYVSDLSRWMQLCILMGYPCFATFTLIMPFDASQLVFVYRGGVVLLAFVLFAVALDTSRATTGHYLVLSFLGLYLVRLISDLTFRPDPTLIQTLIIYCGFVLVPVISVLTFNLAQESDKKLALLLSKFGLVLMLALLWISLTGKSFNPWAYQGGETNRLALEKLNPITIGQVAVTVFLAGIVLLVHYRVKGWTQIITYATIVLAVIVLFSANSRGPIVSGAAALLWFSFGRLRRSVFILAVMAASGVYLLVSTDLLDAVINRFDFNTFENQSNYQRLVFQNAAIQAFLSAPVFGAFAIDTSLPPGSYPHNLIIETAMALGIVGLVLLSAIFLYALRRVFTFYNAEHPLLTALLVHYTLAYQFSGSIFAADIFFMLIGFACVTRRQCAQLAMRRKINSLPITRW